MARSKQAATGQDLPLSVAQSWPFERQLYSEICQITGN